MSKSNHFLGQPSYLQLIKFLDRSEINKIIRLGSYNRYTKHFDSYTHLITLLYAVLSRYDSIREVVVGLLSNATKLQHLGISYCVKRSTFSFANKNRSSEFFAKVYSSLYVKYSRFLLDSRDCKHKLYIMDSTTITLFSNILKGAGRNPIKGKKKGGIKVHTIINSAENVPQFLRFTSAATHDHLLLRQVNLPKGSIIVFDKGYVDYKQYERLSEGCITYVTKLKKNAKYEGLDEIDIPDCADDGILKDEVIILRRGELEHRSRRIAYWDSRKNKLLIFLSNGFDLTAEEIVDIYHRRWQIETLFKQLKQNFQLKYFYGDSVNSIESQIWVVMIANLLLSLVQQKVKRAWSFSNLATIVRLVLMNYIDLYSFLEKPEKDWIDIVKMNEKHLKYHHFFRWGACKSKLEQKTARENNLTAFYYELKSFIGQQ